MYAQHSRNRVRISRIFKVIGEIVAFILLVCMIIKQENFSPDCLVCLSVIIVSFLSAYNSTEPR